MVGRRKGESKKEFQVRASQHYAEHKEELDQIHYKYIAEHPEKQPQYDAKYYVKHREHKLKYQANYHTTHREERQRYAKQYVWKLKLQTLQAYGGQCTICGVKNPQYLTIDHIHDDGAKHRKKIGKGASIYSWLRKNNYPSGFQVLCWNHNAAKSTHPELCEEPYIF